MDKMAQIPSHQLIVPNTIYIDTNLKGNEKLVLSEIVWLQNYNFKRKGQKFCTPSNFYFRSILGLKSDRAITDIIAKLKQDGYIRELPNSKGSFRKLQYDFNKCFERDVILGVVKPE